MVAEKQSSGKKIPQNADKNNDKINNDLRPVDFEGAISATGYGKFNILILLASALPSLVQVLETVSLSYVIPIAHCDLELQLEDKGLLNGAVFLGMVISGFFWGYLCDSLGRKKIIVYGYLMDAAFSILSSFSTSSTFLLVTKLCAGLVLNGPYSATLSHLTEFHSSQYRSRIQLMRGIMMSMSNIILPLLAWAILPRDWMLTFGVFDFKSWNIFLFLCAMVPLMTGIIYMFLPESPKYLMSTGRNQEALQVFKKVYAINKNDDRTNYPVKKLEEETVSQEHTKRSTSQALQEGLQQMKPLFKSPYGGLILLCCFNSFTVSTSSNTLKLWLPQIFQSITDYELHHNSSSSLCNMLGELSPENSSSTEGCVVNHDNMSVYVNSVIVSVARIALSVLTVFLNKYIKTKHLTIILALGNGAFSAVLYFTQDSQSVLIISSLVSAFGSSVDILLVNITLELFPTTLRTVAVSLHFVTSRSGMLIGNIIFPYLLYAGCAPPFLFISITGFCCAIFGFLYPITDNKPLL